MDKQVEIFVLNYNGGGFLEKTLKTIVGQNFESKKIILSDDGSKDGSATRLIPYMNENDVEYRFREMPSGNVHRHCNLCIKEAKAEFVGLFHADDLYENNIVEKQIEFLKKHPEVDAVVTCGKAIDDHDQFLWLMDLPEKLDAPVLSKNQVAKYLMNHGNSFFIFPSALFRREALVRVGGFQDDLKNAGDLEMWLKLLFKGNGLGIIREPLINYRFCSAQGSSVYERTREEMAEFFQVMDSYLYYFDVGQSDHLAYEGLRCLDRLQIGLNQVVKRKGAETLKECLSWFNQSDNKSIIHNFGFVDKLRIRSINLLSPLFKTSMGPHLAEFIIKQTDFRTGWLINRILKLKRNIMRST